MKSICLYFQVHQPYRLKKYRFFNMGKDHHYLDDISNRSILRKVAEHCYLPMNELLLKQLKKKGSGYKVSFSITGIAIEQFRKFAPEVLESFRALAGTGRVEFLAETYSHSLASLCCREEFEAQVRRHSDLIEREFGQRPKVFRNTELIYSDEIGSWVADMGYTAILAEGAKHILGWKSPDFLYANDINPRLKLLLRNFKLSDDLAFRFSDRGWGEWPLTVEKYVDWMTRRDIPGEVINLFMDYETFGEHQWAETGIFEFMKHLPDYALKTKKLEFLTPSEVVEKYQPVSVLHTPHSFSWADEERDVTAWLGNELQDEAFRSLYEIREQVHAVNDPGLNHVWDFMQTSDHFYYMATKWFSDGDVHNYFNPYSTPYEAFINYMNVFSDFAREVQLKTGSEATRTGKAAAKPSKASSNSSKAQPKRSSNSREAQPKVSGSRSNAAMGKSRASARAAGTTGNGSAKGSAKKTAVKV